MIEKHEMHGNDECVCPYCGEEMSDSWELGQPDMESGETQCGYCEKSFLWHRHVSVTYDTSPMPGDVPKDEERFYVGQRVYYRRGDLFATVVALENDIAKLRFEWPHSGESLEDVHTNFLVPSHEVE